MKNAKKALLTLAVLSVAACSASAFSACGEHEHEWGEWTVKTAATCETAGKMERVCAGDTSHKEEQDIPAFGHKYGEWKEKTPATCTEAKVEEHVCSYDASHKETRTVGEALGHTWDKGTVTTQPTEDTPGVRTYKCTVAGCDGSKTEAVPALSHTHKYTGEWQKDGDNHWKGCDGEGCYEIGLSAPHSWNSGTVTTTPTCTAEGVKTFTCGECGATKTESVAVDATAHSWGEWTSKTAATCSAPAVEERVCAHNPEHKETRNVGEANPEAHAWGNWEVTEKPTDNEEGTATRTCSNTGCDATDEKVLPALTTAGVYEITNDTATCEGKGTANYEYEFDGGKVSFTAETPATGHNWGEWVVSIGNNGGEATKSCQNIGCQASKHTALPALSEKDQYQYEDSSTCEMAGQEVYVFVYEGELIQVKTEEVPAKGHNFGEWTEKTAADCTHASVEERACAHDASHTETRTVGEALGHAWGTYTATGGTSMTSAGSVTVTCTREGCDGEVYTFNGGNNGGNSLNGVEDGKTYYLYMPATQTTEKNVTITLKSASVKKGTYEFSFTYLCDEAIVLNTAANISRVTTSLSSGAYIKTEKVNDKYAIVDDFANNIKLDYTADNKLTQVRYTVDDNIVKVGDIKLGVKLTASTKYLVSIKYIAPNALTVGTNNVKVTEDASGDEYTFTSTEDKDYSIKVPEGMTVIMNGETLLTAGTWANFEAKANEQITFKFINSTAGTYAVTIGEAKPDEFKVGNNEIRVSEYNETHQGYIGKYTFKSTSDQDKIYGLSVPEGVDVLIDDTDLIINSTWNNFTLPANETVTFTFIYRAENTFTVTIGDAFVTPSLTVEKPVTIIVGARPAAGGTPATVEVDVEEEATYKVTVSFGNGLGKSAVFFGKNSEGDYYKFSGMDSSGSFTYTDNYQPTAQVVWQYANNTCIQYNSEEYEITAGQRTQAELAEEELPNYFTVTLTLKKGDKLMFAHSNGIGDSFTISLEKVEA